MATGWTGSNRRATLPPDWPKTRRRILQRDGYRCTWTDHGLRCPAPATDVDHIGSAHDHSDANLRSLCATHHASRTGRQGAAARNAITTRRPAEQHPGIVGRRSPSMGGRSTQGGHLPPPQP